MGARRLGERVALLDPHGHHASGDDVEQLRRGGDQAAARPDEVEKDRTCDVERMTFGELSRRE